MKRGDGFVITRTARSVWGEFGLRYTADEAVDALFDLSDADIRESAAGTLERPAWEVAHGRVFGRLVMIGGYKNPKGEWIAVHALGLVGDFGADGLGNGGQA